MTVRYAYRAVYASKHMPGLFEKNLDSGPSFVFLVVILTPRIH